MPTLTWLTRERDINAATEAPYRLLTAAPELDGGGADDPARTVSNSQHRNHD